ncbi:MAG: DUF2963 domain-containing protein [Candidatus Gastranaerophilaceae bacterium]|nr:DUF2963 domain-containing protein [Candidatus Gastranaerophilaceae bacterium]
MNLPVVKNQSVHNFLFNISDSFKFLKDGMPFNGSKPDDLKKEIIYRHNSNIVEKIIEYNPVTNQKVKVTKYDYFNNKKISAVEEYIDDVKVRATCYSMFKSVTEFDKKSGKKFRTTNYSHKDENKISSIYYYDSETQNISKMSVYRPDGKNIAFVKEISPKTGMVTRCINYKKNSSAVSSVSKYEILGGTLVKTTFFYNAPIHFASDKMLDRKITADVLNMRVINSFKEKNTDKLIDNLYQNNNNFGMIKIS